MNFEKIIATYRLTALYDSEDDIEEYTNYKENIEINKLKKNIPYPGHSSKKACHIAIIIKGLYKVINHAKNDYERQYVEGLKVTSLHAEVACIKNVKNIRKKYRLLVLKYNKHGFLEDSKPCSHCKETIIKCGFKEVYYSTGNGEEIVRVKLNELNTRESKSQKQFKIHGFKNPFTIKSTISLKPTINSPIRS